MDHRSVDITSLGLDGYRINPFGKALEIDFHLISGTAFPRMDQATLHVKHLY